MKQMFRWVSQPEGNQTRLSNKQTVANQELRNVSPHVGRGQHKYKQRETKLA